MNIDIEKMRQEIAALEPEAERLWQEYQTTEKAREHALGLWLIPHNRKEDLRRLIKFAEEEANKGAV